MFIYVLALRGGKIYVGKTSDLDLRIAKHFHPTGSDMEWVRRHPPIEVLDSFEEDEPCDENNLTVKYMAEYGIDNVRGGSFCQMELSDQDVKTIQKKIADEAIDDQVCVERKISQVFTRQTNTRVVRCFKCGKVGHYSSECNKIVLDIPQSNIVACFKCGKAGHYTERCNFRGRGKKWEEDDD